MTTRAATTTSTAISITLETELDSAKVALATVGVATVAVTPGMSVYSAVTRAAAKVDTSVDSNAARVAVGTLADAAILYETFLRDPERCSTGLKLF